jgi:hypothetical protein
MKRDTTNSVQTSDASKPRAAKESRRGGGAARRNKKMPSADAPSANLMPQDDYLNFEF